MDTQAWPEGFGAGQRLQPLQGPYYSGTLQAWSWHRGFIEGAARCMGRSYSATPAETAEWPVSPTHALHHGAVQGC